MDWLHTHTHTDRNNLPKTLHYRELNFSTNREIIMEQKHHKQGCFCSFCLWMTPPIKWLASVYRSEYAYDLTWLFKFCNECKNKNNSNKINNNNIINNNNTRRKEYNNVERKMAPPPWAWFFTRVLPDKLKFFFPIVAKAHSHRESYHVGVFSVFSLLM